MGVIDRLLRRSSDPVISMEEYLGLLTSFGYQGVNYALPANQQEEISPNYSGLAQLAYQTNGVVFACMWLRQRLFSEARFQWRRSSSGRPGDLFGTTALAAIERPWQNGTTGDLLARALMYADIAGNAFMVRRPSGIEFLRPDWTYLVVGSPSDDEELDVWDVDAKVLAYAYQAGGRAAGDEVEYFLPSEVAHFAPTPDPMARFRGMSWLTPVIREVMADKAMTDHKLKFMENAATPQLAVKLDVPDLEKFKKWIEAFSASHEGAANAYKTLYLGSGADVTVIGKDLKQLDFKITQGAGETRIAAAAGTPPVIVGLSEGLDAATYSNYGQARRQMADATLRPLWRNFAASIEHLLDPVPAQAELWYDERGIAFLKEDLKDAADIQFTNVQALKQLIDAGFEADSAVQAIVANDLALLQHTGLFSVQLQKPNADGASADGTPPGDTAVNTAATQNGHAELADEHFEFLLAGRPLRPRPEA